MMRIFSSPRQSGHYTHVGRPGKSVPQDADHPVCRAYSADSLVSPVRMRITCSPDEMIIFPPPSLPVCAALMIPSTAVSSSPAGITTSTLILGRKSTTYSAPRYSSVCPFCRPKPFTSVTVRPLTPSSESASRTSSSLNGLMIASIFFMVCSLSALVVMYVYPVASAQFAVNHRQDFQFLDA